MLLCMHLLVQLNSDKKLWLHLYIQIMGTLCNCLKGLVSLHDNVGKWDLPSTCTNMEINHINTCPTLHRIHARSFIRLNTKNCTTFTQFSLLVNEKTLAHVCEYISRFLEIWNFVNWLQSANFSFYYLNLSF